VRAQADVIFKAQHELLAAWYNSQRRFHRHAVLVGLDVNEADDPDRGLDSET